jgi:SAM-dependent methyltransferase
MTHWAAGYTTEIGYTKNYFYELSPTFTKFALLLSGYCPPRTRTACELGFGQGLTVNIHAAASPVSWWGTDILPEHAHHSNLLNESYGSKARLFNEAFEEFVHRSDLPEFDYIALHGVWSWVSKDTRDLLLGFIRRKLRAGGVVYLSYNTAAGWMTFSPIRNLLVEYSERMCSRDIPLPSRMTQSMKFALRVLEANGNLGQNIKPLTDQLNKYLSEDSRYIAHEFFNRDWEPFFPTDIFNMMEGAQLSYGCNANLISSVNSINYTTEQQSILDGLTDSAYRESVSDVMLNQLFRRDFWVKGLQKRPIKNNLEELRSQRFILLSNGEFEEKKFKVKGYRGTASLNRSVYEPILTFLSANDRCSLKDLEEAVEKEGVTFEQLLQGIAVLVGTGVAAPIQSEEDIVFGISGADGLNSCLLQRAKFSGDIGYLASPVTGSGFPVSRVRQLFLLANAEGKHSPHDWAGYAWEILHKQGERLVKDGCTLSTAEENLRELSKQAKEFLDDGLSTLKALQITS